jgi:hypothetical protein
MECYRRRLETFCARLCDSALPDPSRDLSCGPDFSRNDLARSISSLVYDENALKLLVQVTRSQNRHLGGPDCVVLVLHGKESTSGNNAVSFWGVPSLLIAYVARS